MYQSVSCAQGNKNTKHCTVVIDRYHKIGLTITKKTITILKGIIDKTEPTPTSVLYAAVFSTHGVLQKFYFIRDTSPNKKINIDVNCFLEDEPFPKQYASWEKFLKKWYVLCKKAIRLYLEDLELQQDTDLVKIIYWDAWLHAYQIKIVYLTPEGKIPSEYERAMGVTPKIEGIYYEYEKARDRCFDIQEDLILEMTQQERLCEQVKINQGE